MNTQLKETADLLLEFILPFPGEKGWDEVMVYLDITDITLHLLLTEIEKETPGLLYRITDIHENPVAVGVVEEKKTTLLRFLSEGGFSGKAHFDKA